MQENIVWLLSKVREKEKFFSLDIVSYPSRALVVRFLQDFGIYISSVKCSHHIFFVHHMLSNFWLMFSSFFSCHCIKIWENEKFVSFALCVHVLWSSEYVRRTFNLKKKKNIVAWILSCTQQHDTKKTANIAMFKVNVRLRLMVVRFDESNKTSESLHMCAYR